MLQDRGGCTVEDFCNQLHRSLAKDFKYGLVWGTSAKHYPQRCGLAHELQDEDVVQIVKKKVRFGLGNAQLAANCSLAGLIVLASWDSSHRADG